MSILFAINDIADMLATSQYTDVVDAINADATLWDGVTITAFDPANIKRRAVENFKAHPACMVTRNEELVETEEHSGSKDMEYRVSIVVEDRTKSSADNASERVDAQVAAITIALETNAWARWYTARVESVGYLDTVQRIGGPSVAVAEIVVRLKRNVLIDSITG